MFDAVVDGLVDVVDSAAAVVAAVVAANQLANCHLSNFSWKVWTCCYVWYLLLPLRPRATRTWHTCRETSNSLHSPTCNPPPIPLHLSCTKLSLISICLRAARVARQPRSRKFEKKKLKKWNKTADKNLQVFPYLPSRSLLQLWQRRRRRRLDPVTFVVVVLFFVFLQSFTFFPTLFRLFLESFFVFFLFFHLFLELFLFFSIFLMISSSLSWVSFCFSCLFSLFVLAHCN